ncbi:hypothetical protein NKJ46_33605 [Mesorhizobium sp. M0166]|uniref:hypothetical protein n=1 Tax=unclassified Mesorhizobium TaxID=325217 RepID=UPI003338D5DA
MAAPTSRCKRLKESLANGEPSIHGPSDKQTSNPNALQREGLVCAAAAIISGGYGIRRETIPLST